MVLVVDDFYTRYVGDLSRPLQHFFVDYQGVAFSLTGVVEALITMRFRNVATGIPKTGQGSWQFVNPDDAANGIAWYFWHPSDVAEEGLFEMQAAVPFEDVPGGIQHFEIKTIEFLAPL